MRNIIAEAGISFRRLVKIGIDPPKIATIRAIPIPANFVSSLFESSSYSLVSFFALKVIAAMDAKQIVMLTTILGLIFSLLIKYPSTSTIKESSLIITFIIVSGAIARAA